MNKGNLRIINSTISGNSSEELSTLLLDEATIWITNTTIANNTSIQKGVLLAYPEGPEGIGNLSIVNSIIANNNGQNCAGDVNRINSAGHNIDDGTSCNFQSTGDQSNENPLLGPLKYNGGTTPTHALAHNSPAIDAGKPIVCPTYDQRGWLRPIDEGNDNKILCDIGAFEFDAIQVEGSEQENSYIPSLIITN